MIYMWCANSNCVPHNERRLSSKNYNWGRMEGKKKRGRPKIMLLEWMMKEDYNKLIELDVVVNGAIGRTNLPRQAENKEEDKLKLTIQNAVCSQVIEQTHISSLVLCVPTAASIWFEILGVRGSGL